MDGMSLLLGACCWRAKCLFWRLLLMFLVLHVLFKGLMT